MNQSPAAALITAAGMSSRMGAFKPMLGMGRNSVTGQIVATFQEAGVRDIVVITGFHAGDLESHLSGNGIVFLRNENYKTTEMFDSVCIGLRYLEGRYGRILFSPADVPLFTAATVRTLLESDAPLAVPVCRSRAGHPVLIAGRLIPSILGDSGEGGLRGALSRCGESFTYVPVDDPGILLDADTPEDYRRLLAYRQRQSGDTDIT